MNRYFTNISLSQEELKHFINQASLLVFPKKHNVFANGDYANYVYYIERGCFRTYRLDRDGRQVTLSVRFAKELIGIAEVMLDSPRKCFAETLETSCVYAIAKEDFLKLMQEDVEFAMKINQILSSRLRQIENNFYELACYNIVGRLAGFFQLLAVKCGRKHPEGILLDIRLTHQDFANCVGATRQSVTQILGLMKKENVIKIEDKQIIICDMEKLESYIN